MKGLNFCAKMLKNIVGKEANSMKIYSFNLMGFENDINSKKFQTLLQRLSSDHIMCLQEALSLDAHNLVSSTIEKILPNDLVHTFFQNEDPMHKANLVTCTSLKSNIHVEKVKFPRLKSYIWKSLFGLLGSGVPQHGGLVSVYQLASCEKLAIVNVHLDVFGGRKLKLKQATKIKQTLEKIEAKKIMIIGDFNTSNLKLLKEIALILGDSFQVIGDPKVNTVSLEHTMSNKMPGVKWIHRILVALGLQNSFDRRYDWAIVSGICVLNFAVISQYYGSDHYVSWYEIE